MSWASSAAARRVMVCNRKRDTKPELAIRRALHALGLRFRVDFGPDPAIRRPADIVFTRRKIAIYIDGCFWHSCPLHGTSPAVNADYCGPKLARNVERDHRTTAALEARGWTELRFWERSRRLPS